MLECHFCIHASEGPDIVMHQLKSIYNSPFKDSHSHCAVNFISHVFIVEEEEAGVRGVGWVVEPSSSADLRDAPSPGPKFFHFHAVFSKRFEK